MSLLSLPKKKQPKTIKICEKSFSKLIDFTFGARHCQEPKCMYKTRP
jgi:hypothetical protein